MILFALFLQHPFGTKNQDCTESSGRILVLGSRFQGGTSTVLSTYTSPHVTSINLSMLIGDFLCSLITVTKGRVLFKKILINTGESSPCKISPTNKGPENVAKHCKYREKVTKGRFGGGDHKYIYI